MIHVPRFATRSIMIMYLYIADIVYICLYIVYTVPYCNILCLYNGPESDDDDDDNNNNNYECNYDYNSCDRDQSLFWS